MSTGGSNLIREATRWKPGDPAVSDQFETLAPSDGILWLDLVGEPKATDQLMSQLGPACPGLTSPMLLDLLTPDEEPEGRSYAGGQIKLASTFSVETKRLEQKVERGSAQRAGVLIFHPVELLAGDGWLLTCWHPTRTFAGAEKVSEGTTHGSSEANKSVARLWPESGCRTAGDLGVMIMHELALTYRAAAWALSAWLEDWELSLYVEDELDNPSELSYLWGSMAVLRDWLNPLNKPGLRSDPAKAWLPVTNHNQVVAVDDRIDKTLGELRSLSNTMRSSFNVLHVQLAEDDRERKDQARHRVELIAAIFLVPTLVVGFYGANTWVPGQGRHWGFWVMLSVLVLLSSIAVGVVLSWRRAEHAERVAEDADRARARAELLQGLE